VLECTGSLARITTRFSIRRPAIRSRRTGYYMFASVNFNILAISLIVSETCRHIQVHNYSHLR